MEHGDGWVNGEERMERVGRKRRSGVGGQGDEIKPQRSAERQ